MLCVFTIFVVYRLVLCLVFGLCILFFFFKQKTAYEMRISDWSSDVCSSDLTRDEHADTPAITGIGFAEDIEQVALLEPDRDQHIERKARREQQMPHRHRRRRPKGEEEPGIERVTDEPVEERLAQHRRRGRPFEPHEPNRKSKRLNSSH